MIGIQNVGTDLTPTREVGTKVVVILTELLPLVRFANQISTVEITSDYYYLKVRAITVNNKN